MNIEFLEALDDLEREKHMSKDELIKAIEEALVAAYKKNYETTRLFSTLRQADTQSRRKDSISTEQTHSQNKSKPPGKINPHIGSRFTHYYPKKIINLQKQKYGFQPPAANHQAAPKKNSYPSLPSISYHTWQKKSSFFPSSSSTE